MKHRNRVISLLLLLVITAMMLTGCRDAHAELEKNFQDNGKGEPYSQKVPLSEMDFTPYMEAIFNKMVIAAGSPNYTSEIVLPCDVEYYTDKTDETPAVTLEKGTTVYVLPSDDPEFPTVGYGMQCWPDYEKGWRYGQPFYKEEFKKGMVSRYGQPWYYVKSKQLEAVAREFCLVNNFYKYRNPYSPEKAWIEFIDRELYRYGAFCSPELGWMPQ